MERDEVKAWRSLLRQPETVTVPFDGSDGALIFEFDTFLWQVLCEGETVSDDQTVRRQFRFKLSLDSAMKLRDGLNQFIESDGAGC